MRIVLVDDEPLFLSKLEQMVARVAPQHRVAGAYLGAEQALAALEKDRPDLFISDISMQGMSGLELLEEVRERRPSTLRVVLSAHPDFAYAQRALKSEVWDYLLKPPLPRQLEELLDRAAKLCERRRGEALGGLVEAALKGERQSRDDRTYCVALWHVGHWNKYEELEEASGRTRPAMEAIRYIRDALERELEGLPHAAIQGLKSCELFLAVERPPGGHAGFGARLERLFADVSSALATRLPQLVYAADPVSAEALRPSLMRMRQTLRKRIRYGRSSMFALGGDDPAALERERELELELQAVRPETPDGAFASARTFVSRLASQSLTQLELERGLGRLLDKLQSPALQLPSIRSAEAWLEIESAVADALSADDMSRRVLEVLDGLLRRSDRTNAPLLSEHERTVRLVEEYLHKNYNRTITHQSLGAEFGLVGSYINKLFKQHTGATLMDYLTRYRIDRAKRLLLEEPSLLLKEVAARVGFEDQLYFSRVFRKTTGTSPSQFAKR